MNGKSGKKLHSSAMNGDSKTSQRHKVGVTDSSEEEGRTNHAANGKAGKQLDSGSAMRNGGTKASQRHKAGDSTQKRSTLDVALDDISAQIDSLPMSDLQVLSARKDKGVTEARVGGPGKWDK